MNPALMCDILSAFMAEYMSRVHDSLATEIEEWDGESTEESVWLHVYGPWVQMMEDHGLPLHPPLAPSDEKVEQLSAYLREHAVRIAIDIDEDTPEPEGPMN